jgi:nitrate reductase gamma subunit
MSLDNLLFMIFPYVSIAIAILVSLYRTIYRPFTISSLSSQLLERKKLYWGSLSFHWGIVIILLGHLLALLVPRALILWNKIPLRLYLLELSGLALGLWSLVGLVVLLYRRISTRRLWPVTTRMDWVVLILLLVSVVSGVLVATVYRFGSFWFTGIFTPYLLSIITLQPRPELVAPLPWLIKLHVFNFFLLLGIFPFSRLVHIVTLPLGYILRPWQIIIANKRASNLYQD